MQAPDLKQMPITTLKGVGNKLAETLEKLGISSLQDLLFHLPSRYADRTKITAIGDLNPSVSAVIQATVDSSQVLFGKRRSLAVSVSDHSGRMTLRFYHFTAAQKDGFEKGREIRCFGDIRLGARGLEIYHPEYEFLDTGQKSKTMADSLTPIYGLTEGITQPRLRSLIQQSLEYLDSCRVEELIPVEILRDAEASLSRLSAITLTEALRYIHAPPTDAPIQQLMEGRHPYQQRLAFEELLAHNLTVQQSRMRARQDKAASLAIQASLENDFLAALPFKPTNAQQRVVGEIRQDLARNFPMMRLVQGDVGSGKTLVAALAALTALGQGFQVALIAPTEILAEQHFRSFSSWLEPLGIEIGWLVGKLTPAQKRKANEKIASGESKLVIGTHALFQESVEFHHLGLMIVDEQHRFGVHQRLALRNKGKVFCPHQLVMTATPIPRTLAMSVYSDMDVSVIDELPAGRKPINTVVIGQSKREQVIERVREACAQGQQAYWVCTLIEDSETLSAKAAEVSHKDLQEAMPELSIGLVHGRMKAAEKEAVMSAFKDGESNLLVATTVIEVGVDVPNASLMIIENPERLGLSQLHQLRGRVGRGSIASHCVLLYGDPLSKIGRERLQVLRESCDGFVIAEKDLELRGPGELLGTQQTGQIQFRTADLLRDQGLIEHVRQSAQQILQHQPELGDKIIRRWYHREQDYVNV